jgi:hypothetical protein
MKNLNVNLPFRALVAPLTVPEHAGFTDEPDVLRRQSESKLLQFLLPLIRERTGKRVIKAEFFMLVSVPP